MKILIIDDSIPIRKRLIRKIEAINNNCLFLEAGNVAEGIEEFDKDKPDVVILDIKMPGGSGLDVLAHIRKSSFNTPVLVVTNYTSPAYRNKAKELGTEYFFDKSMQIPQFLEAFKNFSINLTC